jgi:prephenate dehydrogenase (NADP+)
VLEIQQFEIVVLWWFDLIGKFEVQKMLDFLNGFAWASPLFLGDWLNSPSSPTRLHLGIVPWEKFLPTSFSSLLSRSSTYVLQHFNNNVIDSQWGSVIMASKKLSGTMNGFVVGIIGMGDMGKMYARRLSDAGWM